MRWQKTASCLFLASLLAIPSLAQQHPNIARGFDPGKVFDTSNLDNINLFNGNLVVTLPIGPQYPVSSTLSYRFTLVYNSNLWDFYQDILVNPRTNEDVTITVAEPGAHFNAGFGWSLHLGKLLPPFTQNNMSNSWLYLSPDGSEHRFYTTLHEGEPTQTRTTSPCSSSTPCPLFYTRDGSYLRLVKISDAVQELEFPDGTVHRFEGGRLVQMRDPFANWVQVTYLTNPTRWVVSDSQGRSHTIYFRTTAPGFGQVDRVELAAFAGNRAVWQFTYLVASNGQEPEICRSCKQTRLYWADPADQASYPPNVRVPFLASIQLPDGSSYRASYNLIGGCNQNPDGCPSNPKDKPGTMSALTLPTGGTIRWEYITYRHTGPAGVCEPHNWPSYSAAESAGVGQRQLLDASGSLLGTWVYSHAAPIDRWGSYPEEAVTTVTSPEGDDTVYYFRTKFCLSTSDYSGWDYSLPFTKNQTDGTPAPDTRYLSVQYFDGTGSNRVLLRSVYVRYDRDLLRIPAETKDWYDSNRRLASKRTFYHDDGGRDIIEDFLNFDGLGHYRTRVVAGHADFAALFKSHTNYNPAFGTYKVNTNNANSYDFSVVDTYPQFPGNESPGHSYPSAGWSGNAKWILHTYDFQQQENYDTTQSPSLSTVRQDTCFAFSGGYPTTGFLQRLWLYKNGSTPSSEDAAILRIPDAAGNLQSERYYGGDGAALPTSNRCGASLTGEAYRVDHTYSYGVLASSQYVDASGAPLPFKVVDQDIDQSTGLVKRSRDTAGLFTDFTYDLLGRLTYVKPQSGGGAWVQFVYTQANGTSPAKVDVYARPNGSTTGILARQAYTFDAFGRLAGEYQLLPSGAWAQRLSTYNAMGWKTSISEWQPYGTSGASLRKTVFSGFDPFGRPTLIQLPDQGTYPSHDVNITYFGVRLVSKWASVATSTSGEADAYRAERYDRLGRLRGVTEPSGPAGELVTTWYGYDGASRLRVATTSFAGITQTRVFAYDGRGFLAWEQLPEKGATGNGVVSYQQYDARGHARRVVDGPVDLSFVYDRGERLLQVKETATGRLLKELTYDLLDGVAQGWSLGKLVQARRHHWQGNVDEVVTESYVYGGTGGKLSQRSTQVALQLPSADLRTIVQTFTWNDLGQLSGLGYPDDQALGDPVRNVSFSYTNGYLTGVGGYASLSYHANGMVAQVVHSNGVTDVYGKDPDDLPRIGSISMAGAAVPWSTGAYQYDGAGNIKKIGSQEVFVYDQVSRLVSASFLAGGVSKSQGASYDAFGNLVGLTSSDWGSQSFAVDGASNRLLGVSYDGAGRMTGWGGFSYSWGPFGEVLGLTGTGVARQYLYTADGERVVERDGGSGEVRLVVRDEGGRVLREWRRSGGSWAWQKDYLWRGGVLLASVEAGGVKHFHVDHLGTVRRITGAGSPAQVLSVHDYYPFGLEATASCQDSERMKFTGHERDTLGTCSQTDDLDYMHARFYNPTVGRFLSPDPLRGNPAQPLSWNLYAYVLNNPLNFFDPLGLETARPTKLADEITVIGSDPCPGVPAGIPCDLWQSVQRDLQHFFWESAMRRLQEGYPQWLSELRNDLGVQLGYSIIGALTPAEEPEVTLFDQAYELWWKKPSLGLGQQDGAKYWGPIGNAFYIFTGGNRGSSCVGWACGLYQALSPMNTASTRVRLAQTKIRRPRFLLQLLFGSREAPVHTFVVLQVKRGDYWVRVRTYDPFWRLR